MKNHAALSLFSSSMLIAAIVLSNGPVHAQQATNINNIYEITPHGTDIWLATKEGGVAVWDTNTLAYEVYTEADGLAHNDVREVAIAPDGTVWMATWGGGVSSYDGNTWTTYTTGDGLGEEYVRHIAVAPDGTVWAASFREGISRFDGETWVTYTTGDGLPSNQNNLLAIAPDGTVWASQANGTLCRFDGTAWHEEVYDEFCPNDGLYSLAFDDDGVMWLGVDTLQPPVLIARIDGGEVTTWEADDDLPLYPKDIDCAPDGTVWVANSDGLAVYDGTEWSFCGTDGRYSTVAVDDYGIVWAGTWANGPGLTRYDGDEWRVYTDDVSIPDNHVHSVVIDAAGGIWAATAEGASRWDGGKWRTFTQADGLPHDYVHELAAAPDGTVWAATVKQGDICGIARFDSDAWNTVDDAAFDGYYITDIEAAADGTLWIAAMRRVEVDGGRGFDGRVISFGGDGWDVYTVDTGTGFNGVTALSTGPDGTVWAGTMSGVMTCDGGTWIHHDGQDGLPRGGITAIEAVSDGSVYAAYTGGVSRYANGTWTTLIDMSESEPPFDGMLGQIKDIEESPDGCVWFADYSGVFVYNGDGFSVCTSQGGNPIDTGTSLATDVSIVLIATEYGVYSYSNEPTIFKPAVTTPPLSVSAAGADTPVIHPIIHPNPFNAGTAITYHVPGDGRTMVTVYSITGQRIADLMDGRCRAGYHHAVWDGTDDNGNRVSTGVYFVAVRQNGFTSTARMTLVK